MLPVLRLGPVALHVWGTLVTAGVLLSWALLLRRTARLGYPPTLTFLWVLLAFPVGALGAKGFVAALGDEGLSMLGSVLGCLVFSAVWIRFVLRVPAPPLLDAVAFTFPLSVAFGRVGCIFNGCCAGRATDIALPLVTLGGRWNLQGLLAVNALVALGVAEALWRRRERLAPGSVIAATIAVEGAGRFLLEFLRDERVLAVGLNPWQLACGLIAAAAAACLRVIA